MADNNVILTTQTFAKLVLMDLGGMLKVAKNMTTSISPEFAQKSYKVGSSIQVRKPYRFIGGDGVAWDPEPLVDQVTNVIVNQVPHVHFQWDSIGKTLNIREAMKLYTRPTAIAIANKVNANAATFAANNALNSTGTPGTAPTGYLTYLTAGDILVELGLPQDEPLNLFVNRRMSSAFVNGVQTNFNPSNVISKQLNQGTMQNALGYEVMLDQTINTRTNGTFSGSIVVNGSQQAEGGNNATMTLTISGITGTLKQGDRFIIGSATSATVGGVNSAYPQGTRASTGRQQKFTVQQDSSANPTSIVVAPAITPSGQYQNVDSAPVDQAIITFEGTTGLTNMQQGLLMHENAFAFLSVPIHEPEAGMGAKVEQYADEELNDLTLSHIAYYDGDNAIEKHKFQCLVGFGNLYREMATVIQA